MPPDLSSHPLIAWARRPEVNQLSRFVAVCEQLTDDVLVTAYRAEWAAAPQRALAGRRYLTTTRQGFPQTTGVSTRGEEHLALAIFNAYGGKPIALPDGELLRVIDYQVPLKARRDDAGVGKIDLLALTASGQVTVIELKAGSGRDTPLRALLEGLAYVAILQANLATVQAELEERGELAQHAAVPRLFLMAPDAYWSRFLMYPSVGHWQAALRELCLRVTNCLGVRVACLALGPAPFAYGSASRRPELHQPLALHDILEVP